MEKRLLFRLWRQSRDMERDNVAGNWVLFKKIHTCIERKYSKSLSNKVSCNMGARRDNLQQFAKNGMRELEVERKRQYLCIPFPCPLPKIPLGSFCLQFYPILPTKTFKGKVRDLLILFEHVNLPRLKSIHFQQSAIWTPYHFLLNTV